MPPLRYLQSEGLVRSVRGVAPIFLLSVMVGHLFAASLRGQSADDTKPSSPVLAAQVESQLTVVEFTDFKCPYCSKMVPVIDELLKAYPGKIRLIVKDFPLDFHPGSELAHEACLAAAGPRKKLGRGKPLFFLTHHID